MTSSVVTGSSEAPSLSGDASVCSMISPRAAGGNAVYYSGTSKYPATKQRCFSDGHTIPAHIGQIGNTYTPRQLLWYTLRSDLFIYLIIWQMLHGESRHESWCNRSASQRASSQYVKIHGRVIYAPIIDLIPCFCEIPLQLGNSPYMVHVRRNHVL